LVVLILHDADASSKSAVAKQSFVVRMKTGRGRGCRSYENFVLCGSAEATASRGRAVPTATCLLLDKLIAES
jgi:hypothetical protein